MNTPVIFEIAKLLKEKGFNKKTDSAYVDTTPFSENENDLVEYAFPQNHNEKEHRISAPTIAEVVMLLYEKHGIWIEVVWDIEINKEVKWYSGITKIGDSSELEVFQSNPCHSPTEAYEAAIIYTLKNLI